MNCAQVSHYTTKATVLWTLLMLVTVAILMTHEYLNGRVELLFTKALSSPPAPPRTRSWDNGKRVGMLKPTRSTSCLTSRG